MGLILDQFGREIARRKPILEEVGAAGIRDRFSGYPSNGLTPERLATILKEADQGNVLRQSELFEEMEEKDTHLGGIVGTRKLTVAGLPWEITAASEEKRDQDVAEFVREALSSISVLDTGGLSTGSFDDALMDLLDALGKGFAISEIMWELREGRVWPAEIRPRLQKQFTFFDPRLILSIPRIITEAAPMGEELPPNKFLYHRYKGRSGVAPRGGVMRPCAWMYLFKNYSLKDWVVFAERYAMPLRIGKYRPGATEAERKVLRDAVFNLGTDAAAIISDSTIIDLIDHAGKTSSAQVFAQLAAFCDAAMSKAVLGHSAGADSTPGKLGGENEARDVRRDLLEADAKALSRTITAQLVRPMVLFNFGPDVAVPSFEMIHEAQEDLKEVAEMIKEAVTIGVPVSVAWARERLGIPEPQEGEALLSLATATTAAAGPSQRVPVTAKQALRQMVMKSAEPDEQDAVDALLESFTPEALQAQAEAILKPVLEMIRISGSYEEVMERLVEAYPDMDTGSLEQALNRAVFISETWGRLNAVNERD